MQRYEFLAIQSTETNTFFLCRAIFRSHFLCFSIRKAYFCIINDHHSISSPMQWLDIAAVVILVIIGIFIYRNKKNG